MKEQTIHFIGCCHCVRLALSSLDRFHHFHVIFIHIFLRLELVLLHLVVFAISLENYLNLFNILLIILRSFQVKHQSTIQNQLLLRLHTLLILQAVWSDSDTVQYPLCVNEEIIYAFFTRPHRKTSGKIPFWFFSAHAKHIDLVAKVEMKL